MIVYDHITIMRIKRLKDSCRGFYHVVTPELSRLITYDRSYDFSKKIFPEALVKNLEKNNQSDFENTNNYSITNFKGLFFHVKPDPNKYIFHGRYFHSGNTGYQFAYYMENMNDTWHLLEFDSWFGWPHNISSKKLFTNKLAGITYKNVDEFTRSVSC